MKHGPVKAVWLIGNLLALALLAAFVWAHSPGSEAVDSHIYWAAAQHPGNPYRPGSLPGDQDFHYSPAFAQALAPFGRLPFEAFALLWMIAQIAALLWLVGPVIAAVLLLLPFTGVFDELVIGNIHILMAAGLVLSFRVPAVWAFPVLTKVTPVIGLTWFAFRREWRQLAWALVPTAYIAIESFAIAPDAWREWVGWLATNPPVPTNPAQLLAWASLIVRLPMGLLLVAVAARKDWRWLLPIAIWLSLPVIWYNSPILLAACYPLAKGDLRRARDRAQSQATINTAVSPGRSA